MNFLKRPIGAILVTVLAVILATGLSAGLKLQKACNAVTDDFYDGVGKRPAIAKQLENLCGCANGIATVAKKNDIPTASLKAAVGELQSSLRDDDIDDIYSDYCDVKAELEDVIIRLTDLDSDDAKDLAAYTDNLAGIEKTITDSGYNEKVREFLNEKLTFPANIFAELFDIDVPEYFN